MVLKGSTKKWCSKVVLKSGAKKGVLKGSVHWCKLVLVDGTVLCSASKGGAKRECTLVQVGPRGWDRVVQRLKRGC